MRIMIVGSGKVGNTLAASLASEGHDVVVMDTSENALLKCEEELDVLTVNGSGCNATSLLEAGVDKCDIVISTMPTDEQNMLCSLIAHRLGADFTIARIRDPGYTNAMTILQKELGFDQSINPERATALEISRLMRYPFAGSIETFSNGRVELVDFRAQPDDVMVGIPLREVPKRARDLPHVLYAAVELNGELVIPNGDYVIQPGSRVYVAGEVAQITSYFRYLKRNTTQVRNVLIMGGGRISYYLVNMISELGIRSTIMELDQARARELSELLPETEVLCCDGTDRDILEKEGLTHFDSFVALGGRDEENLMIGLYAIKRGVKKVIAKNNHVTYLGLLSDLGMESIVSPRDITCSTILRYVRGIQNGQGAQVEKVYKLMNGGAEALEFIVREKDPFIGIELKDLKVRKNALVAVIVRKGSVIVPFGGDHLEAGDHVIIICRDSGISDLNEVIRK